MPSRVGLGEFELLVPGARVVRTDATGRKVLDPKAEENIERGTVWCYVGGDCDALFPNTPTGEGEAGSLRRKV